jgi:hypothetical protein
MESTAAFGDGSACGANVAIEPKAAGDCRFLYVVQHGTPTRGQLSANTSCDFPMKAFRAETQLLLKYNKELSGKIGTTDGLN